MGHVEGSDVIAIQEIISKEILQQQFLKARNTIASVFERDVFNLQFQNAKLNIKNDKLHWKGNFYGFNTSDTTAASFNAQENRKCVTIYSRMSAKDIQNLLIGGVRCFLVEFFLATEEMLCEKIMKIKTASLEFLAKQKFHVDLTLIAKLSPRYPYTGVFQPPEVPVRVTKGEEAILTTDRAYAMACTKEKIYVNAAFTFTELKSCDVLMIGLQLQFCVKKTCTDEVHGVFLNSGELRSSLPIRFHKKKADYNKISLEEILDVTLAREMGIGILVNNMIGSEKYYKNFREALRDLNCNYMKLFCRIVLSSLNFSEDSCKYDWIINAYDGFYIEMHLCGANKSKPEVLKLSGEIEELLEKLYASHKPIILDAKYILNRSLIVPVEHLHHFVLKPDKFVADNESLLNFNYIDILTNFYTTDLALCRLQSTFTPMSYTGVDSLAFAIVTTAYEKGVRLIIVCSLLSLMAIKISHLRSPCVIILVTPTKSISSYVSAYYNVVMLRVAMKYDKKYKAFLYESFKFALSFSGMQNLITNKDKCVLVYGIKHGVKFCDKFCFFQYNKESFKADLKNIFK